jgi:poly-D-alanine transfer protein DltD
LNTWNALLQQIDAPAKKEVNPTSPNQTLNIPSASPEINWDSLETTLIEKHRMASGDNGMGIESGYYKQYINGKRARIRPVPFSNNREWRDFLELIHLLKENKSNASFIISPLHAGYYTNLRDLQPVVDSLRSEIDRSGYPCLNLFEPDSALYRKHLLSDVMHFSEAGWMQVNRFIIQQYGLHRNEN